MIIADMSLDELYDLADLLSDALYLARKYPIDGLDADALKREAQAVEERIDRFSEAEEAAMNRAYERAVLG